MLPTRPCKKQLFASCFFACSYTSLHQLLKNTCSHNDFPVWSYNSLSNKQFHAVPCSCSSNGLSKRPRGPQEAPGVPKSAPRATHELPRGSQEPSKRPQEAPNVARFLIQAAKNGYSLEISEYVSTIACPQNLGSHNGCLLLLFKKLFKKHLFP